MQTLAIILVALQVILLVLVYFGCVYIKIRKRRQNHQGQHISNEPNTVNPTGPTSGPSAAQNVLVFVPYSAAKASLGKALLMNLTCANCGGGFKESDETLRLIPTCGHMLHPTCLVDPCSPLCPSCQAQPGSDGPSTKQMDGDEELLEVKVVKEDAMRLSEDVTKKMIIHTKLVLPSGKLCSPAQFIISHLKL